VGILFWELKTTKIKPVGRK